MKKQISVLALGLSLVVGAALAGCSAGGGQSASGNKSAPNASQEPAPAAKSGPQVFRANLTSEPSTADPGLAKDATSGASFAPPLTA